MKQTVKGFPIDDYTPYGYLRNPEHGDFWGMNSSLVRSVEACGFGWKDHPGADGSIRIGAIINGQRFLFPEDFETNKVKLNSFHHTINLFSFDWEYQGTTISAKFMVPEGDAIAARVIIKGVTSPVKLLVLTHISRPYGFGYTEWHANNTCLGFYSKKGPWYVTSLSQRASKWGFSTQPLEEFTQIENINKLKKPKELYTHCIEGIHDFQDVDAMQVIELSPTPEESKQVVDIVFVRTATLAEGKRKSKKILKQVTGLEKEKKALDEAFWKNAPRLQGDWPASWRHSFIYDIDSTWMCLMPPMGVFKRNWPTWMLNSPRIVMAENCLDMMRLHYADPPAAEDAVLYMFESAPIANIPCMFPTGNLNMIARDGEPCGTSPAWCLPFHNIYIMYLRQLNREWLGKVYPYMVKYFDWWLKNRTDKEGWAVYKCTWEAGEDANPRLDEERGGDTVLTEVVRPAEMQAAMAQSAMILYKIAEELNLSQEELNKWDKIYQDFYNKTQSMWDPEQGIFRDWDKKRNEWSRATSNVSEKERRFSPLSFTIMMSAATKEQQEIMNKKILDYIPTRATTWASWSFSILEGAMCSGAFKEAAEYAYSILERVYPENDRRNLKEYPKPLPGEAREFWPPKESLSHVENECYGWGATTAQFLIRQICGFREGSDTKNNHFVLCPAFPDGLNIPGKKYSLNNIHYRGVSFDLTYIIKADNQVEVKINFDKPVSVEVLDGLSKEKTTQEKITVQNNGDNACFTLNNCYLYDIILK